MQFYRKKKSMIPKESNIGFINNLLCEAQATMLSGQRFQSLVSSELPILVTLNALAFKSSPILHRFLQPHNTHLTQCTPASTMHPCFQRLNTLVAQYTAFFNGNTHFPQCTASFDNTIVNDTKMNSADISAFLTGTWYLLIFHPFHFKNLVAHYK